MDSTTVKFDWMEYSVFTLMLAVSALIGVYFGFIKKAGQDTVDGYLLGSKKMTLFPISMSLISSFISGIALLGIPAEIYTHGINYAFALVSYTVVGLLSAYVFLPVFFKLQLISVYEYMELRFNKFVRKMVSLLFTLSLIVYTPIVIYGPALALSQVSEYDLHTCAILLSAVCIFYTSFGGLKAVVWTDTVQGLVMYGAVFTVAAIGTTKSNGVFSVLNTAYEGGRLDVIWDLDPRHRATAWSFTIGWIVSNTAASAIHPSFVQRFISLSTIKEARWSVFYFMLGSTIFCIFNVYMGLMVYSHYKDCDPLSTGAIHKSDQILSYFIMNVVSDVRGLPGVFIAGIVSAGLSTMSAGLNTLAGTVYEDFIEPVTGKVSDARAANTMKVLVVAFGVLCLLLVMVMEKLGSLVEMREGIEDYVVVKHLTEKRWFELKGTEVIRRPELQSHCEQSRCEQSRCEQSRCEQSHCEQSHCEQSHCEQSNCEQSHCEQSHCEQSHCEQSHCEQSRGDQLPIGQSRPIPTQETGHTSHRGATDRNPYNYFICNDNSNNISLYNSLGVPAFGTVLGIFILGLFFPQVNSTGAIAGGLVSLASMCGIIYGSKTALASGDIVYAPLPVSVEGCTYNFTMPSNSTLTRTAVSGRVFPLFEISLFYYSTLGCLIAVVIGITVSYITGPNKLERVDRDLLSPLVHGFLPDYASVPVKETELKEM